MSDRSSGLRFVLSDPRIYRLFKRMIAGNRRENWLVDTQIRARAGNRVLDIACGPADLLDSLPAVDYQGFDWNESYITEARHRYGHRGEFQVASVGDPPVFPPAFFDIAIAKGILHHLDDDETISMLTFARDLLRPGGRLVTFDGCFVEGQSPIARFLLRQDRGMYVRSQVEYEALASKAFPHVRSVLKHDLLRVPYTHIVLQCSDGSDSLSPDS